jgi:hypothetical protein
VDLLFNFDWRNVLTVHRYRVDHTFQNRKHHQHNGDRLSSPVSYLSDLPI